MTMRVILKTMMLVMYSNILINNTNDSNEDRDVSGLYSGNYAQYSWKNWNDGDPDFPDFPFYSFFDVHVSRLVMYQIQRVLCI